MECHGEEEKDFLVIKIQGSLVVPTLLDQVIADESNEDGISLRYGAWMVTPVQALLLLRLPGVLTDAEIARLDSSTHQIQRSFPGIKTVLRTRAETPSCTT